MDLLELLTYPFLQNAFISACFVALGASIVGYFLVGRQLTFAGHAFPNIGFAGAAGAVLLGIAPVYGLLTFTFGAAVVFSFLGKEARERDLGIGVVMAFSLGLGFFFLALYSGYAQKVYGILFGTILGISPTEVRFTVLTVVLVLASIGLLFRPLLYSSFDEAGAEGRGVPVRMLSLAFLFLTAVVVSLAVQVTGALLVFTLLVGPAATARLVSNTPMKSIALAVLLGQIYVIVAIVLAAWTKTIPVSFFVAMASFLVYFPTRLLRGKKLWKS